MHVWVKTDLGWCPSSLPTSSFTFWHINNCVKTKFYRSLILEFTIISDNPQQQINISRISYLKTPSLPSPKFQHVFSFCLSNVTKISVLLTLKLCSHYFPLKPSSNFPVPFFSGTLSIVLTLTASPHSNLFLSFHRDCSCLCQPVTSMQPSQRPLLCFHLTLSAAFHKADLCFR